MDIVGTNIRQLRRARGLKQIELAGLAGMDSSNLSKLERGEYTWTRDNLTRIAVALKVNVSDLFIGTQGTLPSEAVEGRDTSERWRMFRTLDAKLDRVLNVVEKETRWDGVERRKSEVNA